MKEQVNFKLKRLCLEKSSRDIRTVTHPFFSYPLNPANPLLALFDQMK